MKNIFISLLLLSLLSCATVTHKPISSDTEDLTNTGIRYYESSPYLLVYSNGKGGIVTTILYLPDPNKKMSAKPDAFLAQLSTSMHFKNGVLTSATDIADATVVPKAIIEAAKTVAATTMKVAKEDVKDIDDLTTIYVPAPYLYKIVVNDNQIQFIGKQGDASYKITHIPEVKKGGE